MDSLLCIWIFLCGVGCIEMYFKRTLKLKTFVVWQYWKLWYKILMLILKKKLIIRKPHVEMSLTCHIVILSWFEKNVSFNEIFRAESNLNRKYICLLTWPHNLNEQCFSAYSSYHLKSNLKYWSYWLLLSHKNSFSGWNITTFRTSDEVYTISNLESSILKKAKPFFVLNTQFIVSKYVIFWI